jgi:hypothetical protein
MVFNWWFIPDLALLPHTRIATVLGARKDVLFTIGVVTFPLVIGLRLGHALFFNRKHGAPAKQAHAVFDLVVCSTTTAWYSVS